MRTADHRDREVVALVAAAPAVDADARAALAPRLEAVADTLAGVAITTCHRVELFSTRPLSAIAGDLPAGAVTLRGPAAARRAISLAVGLESAAVAEDQVLHQVRRAVAAARTRAKLGPELESLFEIALRAGRTARSWRPGKARSLVDVAFDRLAADGLDVAGRTTLVVGAGEMGKLAARGARARGAKLKLTSRRDASAAEAGAALGADALPFDPGAAALEDVALVIVALSGPWVLGGDTVAALGRVRAVVDLSQPSATPQPVVPTLTLDDLSVTAAADPVDERFRARLRDLREEAVSEYEAWIDRRASAEVAGALAGRIEVNRQAELEALWQRRPDLGEDERAEIEALTRRLAERLFREPFERLGRDAAGRREQAARELFGL